MIFPIILLCLSACTPATPITQIEITINHSGKSLITNAEVGTTVQSILANQNIQLSPMDKVTPPVFSVITKATTITITAVEEKFETEEVVIPYEQQTVRNESLPERQNILVQTGINGLREITYRSLFEDGQLVSRTVVREIDSIVPRPEIIMVGIQAPFSPIVLPGRLVYLTAGSAWMIEDDTANRIPLVTTGDLDGRILTLSPNGDWLLFTRTSENPEVINELWVLKLDQESEPVYLKTDNIIHFADWMPGYALSVIASTVEKRSVAPGWQANNNLIRLSLGANGRMLKEEEIIESNSGGIYGWWGTDFFYSPDGKNLAYSRPDSIGLVDFENQDFAAIQSIIPFQTRSEWAWTSPLAWSPDSKFIYWVDHQADASYSNPETSPFFDLQVYSVKNGVRLSGPKNVGMFSYPSTSPIKSDNRYDVVFLQAIFPENSETSNYRAMIMDRDGSNARILFPSQETNGIQPQEVTWSACEEDSQCFAGMIYQGNIWLINLQDGKSSQITGDGLVTKMDWK